MLSIHRLALSILFFSSTFFVPAVFSGEGSGDAVKWGTENIAAGKYNEAVELPFLSQDLLE